MKQYIYLLFGFLLFIGSCSNDNDQYRKEMSSDRMAKDSSFLVVGESPLSSDQIDRFIGLEYFPINEEYIVDCRIELVSGEEIIKMKTSTDRMPDYRVFGYVYFQIDGQDLRLTSYQNISLQEDSVYKNFLFIPFTDDNSTITTYGGGRYLDFEIPKSDTFILDFNKSYNPYCAYNHKWSCVIPPRENSLQIAINAGEKMYPDVH
ncbi:MAG: DUF1684 domain-containing protein [Bacteroidales bacterium]|nr:DUF1684 domain-containing protein [Bacteroidales bacterium]